MLANFGTGTESTNAAAGRHRGSLDADFPVILVSTLVTT